MRHIKVGILTFSDEREYIHNDLYSVNQRYQDTLKKALTATGELEVIAGEEIIGSPEAARREAKRLQEYGVDLTIFNYAIWCYPRFSAIATSNE